MLGVLNILLGFCIAIFLLLSTASRWWRIWALPVWFLGFAFLLAGANGVCLVLYVTSDRHLRPWEQFTDDSASTIGGRSATESSGKHGFDFEGADDQTTLANSDALSVSQSDNTSLAYKGRPQQPIKKAHASLRLEAFGTANSHGHEVWVEKYRAKMMIRKIFDRTVWVENEHVRIVQDKVAYQALLWAAIASVPLTVVFVAVPSAYVYS